VYKLVKGNARDFSKTIASYPESKIVGFHTSEDLSLFSCLVWTEGEVAPIGEPLIVEKIVEVEVIKEVPFDNPELLEQIQTLQDALSDALNAEEKAKREAEDLKKQIPKLKMSVTKLKKSIASLTED